MIMHQDDACKLDWIKSGTNRIGGWSPPGLGVVSGWAPLQEPHQAEMIARHYERLAPLRCSLARYWHQGDHRGRAEQKRRLSVAR